MEIPHGASGTTIPKRPARRALAAAVAALSLLIPEMAQGDEPVETRISPAVAFESSASESAEFGSRRLPPVEEALPAVAPATYQSGDSLLGGPYPGQAVNYINVPTSNTSPASPLTALNAAPGQPLFRFSGMQEPQPPAEDGEQAEPAAASADGGGAGEQQTFGQAPTNNALQFLRDVDVLLAPGAWQADTGFVYTHFANDFPLPIFNGGGDLVDVEEAEVRQRLLFTPLALRYGLTNNIQLFASLPVGFSNTQFVAPDASETFNVSGLGDLTFGASVHLIDGEDQLPDIIGTVGFTAPTGKFNAPIFGLVPGSNLGQGFWAYSAQLLAIHRYDPVIVFYGGGYRHLWERPFDGVYVAPGEQANYMLGVGFSVNDRVTLSTTFQGFYLTNTYVDGEAIRGSNLEPLTLRFAATIVRDCRIIEPFVQIGMTDSAPRANVGVVVTFY